MKLSVALATFNGEKFLKTQLESINKQTRLPDELVVSDDCSTDATVDVILAFKKIAKFNVILSRNSKTVGYSANFQRAISLCTGDLIFICDQDDKWFESKIEVMSSYMEENPEVFIAINDAEITNRELYSTGITKLQQIRTLYGGADKFIAGCCSVFRTSLQPLYYPIPIELEAYDGWLHFLGKVLGSRRVIPLTLQYYRIHGNNTSRFEPNSTSRLTIINRCARIWKKIWQNNSQARSASLYGQLHLNEIVLSRLVGLKKSSDFSLTSLERAVFPQRLLLSNEILKLRLDNISSPSISKTLRLLKIAYCDGARSHISWFRILSDLV
jgi:glycosyltransferase involved in cell wall biosynthesis